MTNRERQRIRDRLRLEASIADYITQCDEALERARELANGGWPDSVKIPYWRGGFARLAFMHWLDELRAKAGKIIQIEYDNPPAFSADETTEAERLLH